MSLLNFLSKAEVDAVHEASLRILNETGVILTHQPAVDLLLDFGASVEGKQSIISSRPG